MARLVTVSGLGGKAAACFLLETAGRRLLLDLGREPGTGRLPDLDRIGRSDALLLSHGHDDHAGAIDLLDRLGRPPVYATATVAAGLPAGIEMRHLPLRGAVEVAGIPVATGRNGHAPGGVWLHLATPDGGVLYAGDVSLESALYAFDPPPPARLVVLDASYGLDDVPQEERKQALASLLDGHPTLLPAPPGGRGPELALFALEVTGRVPALCAATRGAARALLGIARPSIQDAAQGGLRALIEAPALAEEPEGVMVVANADASAGAAAELVARWRGRPQPAIVFTGHVPARTPAARLLGQGRALWRRWNVHPRLSDNVRLARATGAGLVLPAFTDAAGEPALAAAFAPARVVTSATIDL